MRTRNSYLASKLMNAIERIQTSKQIDEMPVYKEVCTCPSRGGTLCYDTSTGRYFGKGACSLSLLCAQIKRDKHHVLIKKTYGETISNQSLEVEKQHYTPKPIEVQTKVKSTRDITSYF